MDSALLLKKLNDEATAWTAGGTRPPPHDTRQIKLTYGEIMLALRALYFLEAVRDAVKN